MALHGFYSKTVVGRDIGVMVGGSLWDRSLQAMAIKTHTFRGRKYNVIIEHVDGICDKPTASSTLNFILPDGPSNTKKFLESAIHESMHGCFPSMSEDSVSESAKDITRMLWRIGFRLGEKE